VTCVLAQFPPQTVNADSKCQASLPNYVQRAVVTGGCTGFTVTQLPAPGTLLTATNKIVTVTLTATGTNGKSSKTLFTVTLADTITPKFGSLTGAATIDTLMKKSNQLYDIADKMNEQMNTLADAEYLKNTGTSHPEDYKAKMLLNVSMYDSTGISRHRFSTYVDSLKIPLYTFTK
jgi:hypothetical protein